MDPVIEKCMNELDALVTKDDAKLLIWVEEPEEESCEIVGNRKGYVRAAIEMLRASQASLRDGEFITLVDFDYLGTERSLLVKRLIRREDVEAALPPVEVNTWKQNIVGIGCVAFFVFFVVCAFTGFGDLITWFFRK